MLPFCGEEGIGVIPYNPIAGGLLSGKHARAAPPPEGTRFTLGNAAQNVPGPLLARPRVRHGRGARPAGRARPASAWSRSPSPGCWRNPAITAPIIGASRPDQLDASLAAAEFTLDPELKRQLDERHPRLPHGRRAPVTGCPASMTDRKPPEMSFRTWINQQISQAEERGAFDNLPGAGQAAPPQRRGRRRPGLAAGVRAPGGRAERGAAAVAAAAAQGDRAAGRGGALLASEQEVRDAVAELNARIMEWRRIPVGPPVFVPLADEEALVTRWREAHPAGGRSPRRPRRRTGRRPRPPALVAPPAALARARRNHPARVTTARPAAASLAPVRPDGRGRRRGDRRGEGR